MVKDFKYIIKRVIIGILIALALMYLKGGLIANVNALEVYSWSTSDNSNFATCSNCSNLDYNLASFTNDNLKGKNGYLLLSFSIYSTSSPGSFAAVISRLRVTNGTNQKYNCEILSDTNQYYFNPTSSSQVIYTTGTYTAKCPVHLPDNGSGITNINFQTLGNTSGISLYSPMTFIIENNSDITNAIEDNTDAINETNDTLKSEDSPDTEGLFSDIDTDDSNSPVSDLITMPITLLQALNNNSGGSCTTWNLGTLLGKELTMPCINIKNIVGANLYNIIDMAICLFLAYNLGLMCISIYNNLTSLNDDFDSMYAPKHEEHGKHGRVE